MRAFQEPDGPQLIVCATRVAGQGITLTRASNVCFLELEWTPAMHDQAEDRCHRIGQRDAVTAWYLLAADTIDETMARLIAAQARASSQRSPKAAPSTATASSTRSCASCANASRCDTCGRWHESGGCRRPGTVGEAVGPVRQEVGPSSDSPVDVAIRGDMIRLGQLLKLADVVDSGGEAKVLLAAGGVSVNGEPEQRRGRQLRDGDVVTVAGRALRVTAPS